MARKRKTPVSSEDELRKEERRLHTPISPVTGKQYDADTGRYAFDTADEDILTPEDRRNARDYHIRREQE